MISGPPSFGYDWGWFDDGYHNKNLIYSDVGDGYPLINIQKTMEHHHAING